MSSSNQQSLSTAIGHTPLVELSKLFEHPGVRFFAKLETANPSGSVKDRVAQALISAGEDSGALNNNGEIILEASSGNTGIALAMLARAGNYQLKVVVPENVTAERINLLRAYQAEIIFSPGALGSNGAVQRARELAAANPDYYWTDQYSSAANIAAHYQGTGREIQEQLPEVTAFVAGLGTGGTLMGVGQRLKESNPKTVIAAAEPRPGDQVQGLRSLQDGFIPEILDLSLLDRKVMVSTDQSILWTKKLLVDEGLFAGPSAGAIAAVADRLAADLNGGNVVLLIPDNGWRYLSSGIYTEDIADLDQRDQIQWW